MLNISTINEFLYNLQLNSRPIQSTNTKIFPYTRLTDTRQTLRMDNQTETLNNTLQMTKGMSNKLE